MAGMSEFDVVDLSEPSQPKWEIVGVKADEPPATSVDITAAGWLWAVLREIEFNEEGEPDGYKMHEKVKAFAREQWPWLDEAAEKYWEAMDE